MPLPAALLSRLKKRGIIKPVAQVQHEEIIAENYDDDPSKSAENRVAGAPGCPNKWNQFHLCVEWCWDHWNDGIPETRIDQEYNRKRLRMLRLHPLPPTWKEIYDPGTGRYYYWNVDTDEVCWLSPMHPKAKITVAACRVAKNEWENFNRNLQTSRPGVSNPQKRVSRPPRQKVPQKEAGSDEEEPEEEEERPPVRRETGGGNKRARDLDPMDPAAYSDIPRGKWSSGLEGRSDAKTGVDSTASGPLFQQRPYPSPGAVLRQNMEGSGRKKRREAPVDDDDD